MIATNRVWEVDKMQHAREEGIEVDIFKMNFRCINQHVQMNEQRKVTLSSESAEATNKDPSMKMNQLHLSTGMEKKLRMMGWAHSSWLPKQ